ncbi:unnamed protein product, partial [Ectocarpus sp. 8 AP-2014]
MPTDKHTEGGESVLRTLPRVMGAYKRTRVSSKRRRLFVARKKCGRSSAGPLMSMVRAKTCPESDSALFTDGDQSGQSVKNALLGCRGENVRDSNEMSAIYVNVTSTQPPTKTTYYSTPPTP